MKKRPRLSTTATAVTLAVLLNLVGGAGADGLVVCTDDTRIAADRLACDCCSYAETDLDSGRSERPLDAPTCSDCVDVPLTVPSVETRVFAAPEPHASDDAPAIALKPAGERIAGHAAPGKRPVQHWRLLMPLSTVVLLT